MDFLAVPDDLTTEDLEWSVQGIDLDYGTDGEFFRDSAPNAVDDEFLEIPGGLPSIVRNLALAATDGAQSDYEAALLLQAFFRENFEYSLERHRAGIGGNAFETFLSDTTPGGRTGYCEQFASAMAVMARMVSIPARVAIGFLEPAGPGQRQLRVQLLRPARLAGALLRGRRLGAVRAHPVGARRGGAQLLDGAGERLTADGDHEQPDRFRAERRHPDGSSPGNGDGRARGGGGRRREWRRRRGRLGSGAAAGSRWHCWCSSSSALSR